MTMPKAEPLASRGGGGGGGGGILSNLSYRIYNLGLLPVYDTLILNLSCTLAWRCPTDSHLLPFFRRHMSTRHLDIGVGTGYFPATVLAEMESGQQNQYSDHGDDESQHSRSSSSISSGRISNGSGGGGGFHPSQGSKGCGSKRDTANGNEATQGEGDEQGILSKDEMDKQQQQQQITLWDLSNKALARAAGRIRAVAPSTSVRIIEGDALVKPTSDEAANFGGGVGSGGNMIFDSISAFNLLHCIPAQAEHKAGRLFANARRRLSADGVLVGSTVLGRVERWTTRGAPAATMDWVVVTAGQGRGRGGAAATAASQAVEGGDDSDKGQAGGGSLGTTANGNSNSNSNNPLAFILLWAYNRFGIFTNWDDGPDDFTLALEREFEAVETWIVGRMLLFRARKPRNH